jgi:rod shape-determining protein MreC
MAVPPMPSPRRNEQRWLWLISRALMILFVVLSLGALMLNRLAPETAARWRGAALDSAAPILFVLSQPVDWISSGVAAVGAYIDAAHKAEALQAEITHLRALAERNAALEAENKTLRSLLGVRSFATQPLRVVRVVGGSGASYVQGAILSAGARDGIAPGQAVRDAQGLVGRVSETGHVAARVLLLTDLGSRIPVRLVRTGQTAILDGRNAPLAELIFLPTQASVQLGDQLVTSGHGGLFPPDIPVGTVVSLAGRHPLIRPTARLGELSLVLVLQAYVPPNIVPNALEAPGL